MRARPFLRIAVLLCAGLLPVTVAEAEPVFGGDVPVTIDNVEFRLKSLILTEEMGNLSMQVAMTTTDLDKTPDSLFIEERGSSVVTDTGLVFNATIMNAAGIGACHTIREDCVRSADQFAVDIYPGVANHMTFTVRSNSASISLSHQVLGGASTADVSIIFYVRKTGGGGAFIPVTFENVRLKNMMQ